MLKLLRATLLAVSGSLLIGCVSSGYRQFERAASQVPPAAELSEVPFFPQQDYQCGPAALATVLVAAGVDTNPEALEPQVYTVGRRGSLQLELKAAVRRHGLLPYEHHSGFAGLLEQLAARQPVLVLQNLGFSWAPVWHYAVVIDYDEAHQQVVLRSGQSRRKRLSLKVFEHTWRHSEYWALTVHAPGDLPKGAELNAYLTAVAGLEAAGQLEAARDSYLAATVQWPDQAPAWMGLGNADYQLKHYARAEQAYRRASMISPEAPAPWHNLAWALIRQARPTEALPFARKAVDLAGANRSAYSSALKALRSPD